MNIILTGVTGILGREVLAELILHHIHRQPLSRIICLARASRNNTACGRVENILKRTAEELKLDVKELSGLVSTIDVTPDRPGSFESLLNFLREEKISETGVLHLASSTNLSPLAATEEEILKHSYLPALDLLNTLLPFASQYSFVSTAFSCGHQHGLIPDEFLKMRITTNRNYYERLKLQAEKNVKQICEQHNIKWQVLRSCIVSGRLVREPYYYIPKFNVFYAWTGFFNSLKSNGVDCEEIRIRANIKTGMNILPSDYVARGIVRAYFNREISELNITHSRNFENISLIPSMLESVGINRFEFTGQIPENPSLAEKLYYKTVGLQFTPYMDTYEHEYDSAKIRKLLWDVPEPDVKKHFGNMLAYAAERQFKSEAA